MADAAYRRSTSRASTKFRKLLLDVNLTGRAAAREIGVTPSTISHIIAGDRTSERVLRSLCEAIASRLNRDVRDLFPEYARLWNPYERRVA